LLMTSFMLTSSNSYEKWPEAFWNVDWLPKNWISLLLLICKSRTHWTLVSSILQMKLFVMWKEFMTGMSVLFFPFIEKAVRSKFCRFNISMGNRYLTSLLQNNCMIRIIPCGTGVAKADIVLRDCIIRSGWIQGILEGSSSVTVIMWSAVA
jgi:hypothetical protein